MQKLSLKVMNQVTYVLGGNSKPTDNTFVPWLLALSAAVSLGSLAWAVAAYTRAMRKARPDKNCVSWPGLVLQATWRGGMLAARIAALVIFALGFHSWIFMLLGKSSNRQDVSDFYHLVILVFSDLIILCKPYSNLILVLIIRPEAAY